MTQFHVALGRRKPGPSEITVAGLTRTVLAGVGVGLYIVIAWAVSARLHLEGQSAYWMSFGVLCLLLVLARYLRARGMGDSSERGIGLYVLAIGLAMFAFGLWRQLAVDAARRRCVEALAAADDVHQRLRVYRSIETLPTLSKSGAERTMTCERLLHS